MTKPLPLSTLLSYVLVAYTIEFDNEFEHRTPHRTSRGPSAHTRSGPWLVSLAMWANFMQFIGDEGVPLRDVEPLARMTNLAGLERWGYVVVEPDSAGRPTRRGPRSGTVRATRAGRMAREAWRPLAGEIEARWRERFGVAAIAALRASLDALVARFDIPLPWYLPVVHHGLSTSIPPLQGALWTRNGAHRAANAALFTLLSRVLYAFTVEFERASSPSLPLCANTLRVLDDTGVCVRDLPKLTGVSKEAIAVSVAYLEKRGLVSVERDPSEPRTRRVRVTARGRRAQDAYRSRLSEIERQWKKRFGAGALRDLRASLEHIVGDAPAADAPLMRGLKPYPDGWRAALGRRDTLPCHPMVLHRGGYPDGA